MVQNTPLEVMTESACNKGSFWGLLCDLGILSQPAGRAIHPIDVLGLNSILLSKSCRNIWGGEPPQLTHDGKTYVLDMLLLLSRCASHFVGH